MIIPVYVDEIKDEELINWLKTKTNRSATIREILYAYKKGLNIISFKEQQIEIEKKEKSIDIDNNFMNSLNNFKE